MKTHKLKISKKYYQDVVSGLKTFEIRQNDRDYKVNDTLILMEYDNNNYTGKTRRKVICYICDYMQRENYVVLGICDQNMGASGSCQDDIGPPDKENPSLTLAKNQGLIDSLPNV